MAFLPWATTPFLRSNSFKRFFPGAFFMALFVTVEGIIAEKKKWWWFPIKVKPNVLGEMPLIIGPFFVGSLWILKYTFGNFKLYILINLIIDSIFTYLGINWFKNIGYGNLVRLTKPKLSLLFLLKSVLMYGFQMMYEKLFTRKNMSSSKVLK